MTWTEIGVAVALAIGTIGIIVPVLPGTLLVGAALLVWALEVQSTAAWVVLAIGVSILAAGQVAKWALPGKHLKTSGVPNSTLVLAGLVGFVGFFVVPVIGIFLGFVLGLYLAEVRRVGRAAAWPSTRAALKAVGLSILIEFIAAIGACLTWAIGVWTTRAGTRRGPGSGSGQSFGGPVGSVPRSVQIVA